MGKIKKSWDISLKWRFIVYLPVCIIMSLAGSFIIGTVTNNLQDWYQDRYPDISLNDSASYYISPDNEKIPFDTDASQKALKYQRIYFIISNAQIILIPVWVMLCFAGTGTLFYNCELKKPFAILKTASEKISENQLDFKVSYPRHNELGLLCDSFENMRQSLYDNNLKMWHSLEERKRLNSAFSHDLRTPLTVLRGYTDFLYKYVPEGKVSEEKLMSTLSTMNSHIDRLEHYVQGMNCAAKLEDLEPSYKQTDLSDLNDILSQTAQIVKGSKKVIMNTDDSRRIITADSEIIMQVFENLISNSFRYAVNEVIVSQKFDNGLMYLTVTDDGPGFSENALAHCTDPFYRDEKEKDKTHFGLGLYICNILCSKHGGSLKICNTAQGHAQVTAAFLINQKNP